MKHLGWVLAWCVVGCAAEVDGGNGSEEDTDHDGVYGLESDPASDAYKHADAEKAWAAIPAEMRPSELLDALKGHLLVPKLEHGGRAMFTDIVRIEAGEDVTYCTYLDYVTDQVLYVHDSLGSQTAGGHHAILQYLTTPQPVGTRDCPDESDLGLQPGQILGGTGGEGNGAIELAANVVSEVPVGAQLVINHHWINTGDEAIDAQAEMITVPPTSNDDLVIARAMAVVATDFEIPAGVSGEASVECTFPREVKLLSMIGHEHQWGTRVRAERMGEPGEMIFDHDYTPEMVSQPLTTDFSLDAPFRFAEGDTVRMTCEWHNTSSAPLIFPREMCVLFGWQIDADADTQCVNGTWL